MYSLSFYAASGYLNVGMLGLRVWLCLNRPALAVLGEYCGECCRVLQGVLWVSTLSYSNMFVLVSMVPKNDNMHLT